jgi:hypothetical protein
VLDHLHRLALAVDGDADSQLRDDAARLTAVLVLVVSGFVGVQIVLHHSGHPVVLTVPHEDRSPAVTSVGVRLRSVSTRFEGDSRAVVYSRTPGSLVDLAADLAYALGGRTGRSDSWGSSPVELDVDLPFTATETAITGLDELATIHRAIGFLIDRGHHPDLAADTLHGQAVAAGLTTHAFASRLLAPGP